MPPAQSEQDLFLKDLQPDEQPTTDPFEQPLVPEQAPAVEAGEPTPEETQVNRRERRLQAKLQAERESAIALAAKLQALSEAQEAARQNAPSEYLKRVERIYGTDSPEAQAATQLLAEALQGVEERATERALEQFRAEQQAAREQELKAERELDDMVGEIEDTYNVTLDPTTQKTFFQLLEKLSPKDRDGNITAYADPLAVWEELQHRKQPQTRQKDLATRGLNKTGASPATSLEQNSQERWLRDNGII